MLTFNEACKVLGLTIRAMPLPVYQYTLKAPYKMLAQGITIHNTANDASALAEISYMNGNSQEVSYHWATDHKEAINSISHDRTAWHCGDGHGNGNMTTIGIEIGYSKTEGHPSYPQSEENGAKLAAVILYVYGWGLDRMHKHQDWSGKYCPHRILDNQDWENFKAKVQGYLDQLKKGAVAPEKKEKSEEEDMFTISAPNRGIALMTGGRFYALLDANDPAVFWGKGVPHMQVSTKTFDNFQSRSNLERLDDETVKKLTAGLK